MTIVDKYLAREILKCLVVVLAVVVSLFVIAEFFNKADNFMEAGLPISRLIRYLQLKLPQIIAQITPIGLLLAVLIAFGLMNKNNEIIALKSGGVSVYYLLRPVLTIAVFLAILLFSLSEIVVPITISKANKIWLMEVKNKPTITSKQRNIWIKGHRAIYFIQYFNPQNQTISGVILNFFDKEFKLTRRVDAKKGVYVQGKWVFYDSMEQVLDEESAIYNVRLHSQKAENVDFLPEDLMRVFKKSDEMNIAELFTYIKEVELEGYDATTFRVDFHARFAYPVLSIIVCLMGTGIAVKRKSREGPSVSIAFGAVMVFLYWVLHSFCLSLGYGGLLPPVISAWISNIIFLCYGVLNLINAE
ncbi:MAG: LPS export ABC transporter permease LptG [Desulfobacterales bacterium]|jgi:lipopolysaccharide export system permease protein|nr:LPS export ABC transporter permease LptG [Desulfobacterales bacterium]